MLMNYEFEQLAKEVTKNLRKMTSHMNETHDQFGEPDWYVKFVEEMDRAYTGWMHSHC